VLGAAVVLASAGLLAVFQRAFSTAVAPGTIASCDKGTSQANKKRDARCSVCHSSPVRQLAVSSPSPVQALVKTVPDAEVPNDVSAGENVPEGIVAPRPDRSAAVERQVRAFAVETDRWVRPQEVTVADIEAFGAKLKAVPQARRLECLRRALNLIPDANAALLAGVVLDKSQGREVVETTFRDIVNRSEEVKEPILKEIAKDKTHPCLSDVEWIYAVTGEKAE